MIPHRRAGRPLPLRSVTLAFAAVAGLAAAAPASAETRVRARYEITLSGFEIGTANMQTGIDRGNYDINLSIRMTGLARFFTGGKGAATARGGFHDAQVTPTAYALNTRANDKGQIVRLALAGGSVRQLAIEPKPKTKNVIPVSDADKRGVLDPLSAIMMPVAGSGDLLAESSCDRTLPVFDGRARYDITLRYDRTEIAKPNTENNADPKAKGGYEGKVIVCKASYKPISGHRPDRDQVKFMEKNKDMEVWLAPIAGANALMPWKISVRTQMGVADITATSFVIDDAGMRASRDP
jgi:hypothetical protein